MHKELSTWNFIQCKKNCTTQDIQILQRLTCFILFSFPHVKILTLVSGVRMILDLELLWKMIFNHFLLILLALDASI